MPRSASPAGRGRRARDERRVALLDIAVARRRGDGRTSSSISTTLRSRRDPPPSTFWGTTWRDRPTTTPAADIWLAGDWAASPGHPSEVSATSAIAAARATTAEMTALRPAGRPPVKLRRSAIGCC